MMYFCCVLCSLVRMCLVLCCPLYLFILFFLSFFFFFFNDTATTEIYTLSLHDALPICGKDVQDAGRPADDRGGIRRERRRQDRKSTRLNSSHLGISYAVFCLKKKKKKEKSKST